MMTKRPTLPPMLRNLNTILDSEVSKGNGLLTVLRTRRYTERPLLANPQATRITMGVNGFASELWGITMFQRGRRVRRAANDSLASNFWGSMWSRRVRRAIETGVWKGIHRTTFQQSQLQHRRRY